MSCRFLGTRFGKRRSHDRALSAHASGSVSAPRMSSALRLFRAAPGGAPALSARARVARRPRARLPLSRAETRVAKAFCYVSWFLDSPGCSGHRSGDSEVVGVENSHRCPPRPIDLGALCEADGEAVVGAASFAVRDERLFVRNAHAAELEALEARSRRSALRSSALDPSHDEYDSFIDVEEEDEETCVNEEVLDDGDVVCGVEDPFEFAFYPSSFYPSKTKNEFADDADERRARDDEIAERELFEKAASPRAVRVDGLRLKPRGEAELTPGAMVDIGLASTAFAGSGLSRGGKRRAVGETRDFYDGVFEVRRVARARA